MSWFLLLFVAALGVQIQGVAGEYIGGFFDRAQGPAIQVGIVTEAPTHQWRVIPATPEVNAAMIANAADVGESHYEIILTGRSARTVVIRDIRPVVDRCGDPIGGDLVARFHGGPAPKVVLGLDLDGDRRTFRAVSKNGKMLDPYFIGPTARKVTLSKGEVESFVLSVKTTRRSCEWRVAVDYTAHGKPHTTLVTRTGGVPFRTTARLPETSEYSAVHHLRDPGKNVWERTDLRAYCAEPARDPQMTPRPMGMCDPK
ncbi:hypothetical protein [Thermomonospora umbrina]|uniref:Uncharacterized protein n=1 Tax=Thermomonospora umbrina TaxID=111806 RepID=A0A3D9SLE2_9ACTN|nr:hypothetical protein [Thermomonospora umbrina]REE96678.1 hypothetical protein DFJ69_2122 [Thermomonospora umbrina]